MLILKFGIIILFSITILPVVAEKIIFDPNFVVEEVVTGLDFPVQMEFIENDLLILQKNDGKVRLVEDGFLYENPVLEINDVYNAGHLGLLGITTVKNQVYLYVSQNTENSSDPVLNRIYKYDWIDRKLINPKLVNELPTGSAFDHTGGKMVTGLDGNVYAIIGDTMIKNGTLQNNGGNEPDDTSIILRVGIDNNVTRPFLSENVFEHYHGIGIRNSFGLSIDPVTGYLWDTENGPESYDEINLVLPKFNSGWNKIQGPSTELQRSQLKEINNFKYSDPEFSWEKSVAPTGILFTGEKWGEKFNDFLFVGDFNTGTIYKFKLNSSRTGFDFKTPEFNDLVANVGDPLQEIIFGIGFGAIADIKIGPDNSMYVLSFENGGTIYRINVSEKNTIFSPYKQSQSGISPSQISCPDGLVLVLKISNNQPSCVQPNTAVSLIQRQWGKQSEQNILDRCDSPPTPKVNWSDCNFSFADVRGINLKDANLSGINFVGADLSNSILTNSNLTRANMVFATLENVDFSSSDMTLAKFLYSNLYGSNLTDVKLNSANLSYADLIEVNLQNSILNGAYLTNANLSLANVSNATLLNTSLHFTNLEKTNFSNANLENANFWQAILKDTNFSNCKKHTFCEK